MPQVTVYTTSTCRYCPQVKDYLRSISQPFEEVVLDQEPARIEELESLSGQRAVPVTMIVKDDNTTVAVLGWDQEVLEKQLE